MNITSKINKRFRDTKMDDQSMAKKNDPGFTLLELLIVVIIVSILAAIGIPSWISLVNRTKINNARSEVFQSIREAQSKAKQKKVNFEASFQNATNSNGQAVIQWAVNSTKSDPIWQSITVEGVEIDEGNTNLNDTSGWWSIEFDEQGEVAESSNTGKITVVNSNNTAVKRCVFVQSLLGAMRSADNADCEREN